MYPHSNPLKTPLFRFEAEISAAPTTSTNRFIPHQVKQPIIGANTYRQVQQKLSSSAPPPVVLPPFVPPQMQAAYPPVPESYVSQPTPVVLSSAPKLYTNRTPSTLPTPPTIDVQSVAYDVSSKLKRLKSSMSSGSNASASDKNSASSNPIAEEAISAARASSALQSFTHEKKSDKKSKKTVRTAGGQVWEDQTLAEWSDDDYRIFAGDLGNDVNDELLIRTFSKYPSFQKAKVLRDKRTGKSKGFGFISFKEPQDFIRAMKEMDGEFSVHTIGHWGLCKMDKPVYYDLVSNKSLAYRLEATGTSCFSPWDPSRRTQIAGEWSSSVQGSVVAA